jgi:hypothetical protein
MTDADGEHHGRAGDTDHPPEPGWPWSFILLVFAGALYLIFRFVELGIRLLT